jgi:hypothetical protein
MRPSRLRGRVPRLGRLIILLPDDPALLPRADTITRMSALVPALYSPNVVELVSSQVRIQDLAQNTLSDAKGLLLSACAESAEGTRAALAAILVALRGS